MKETQTGKIEHKEFDEDTVERMIHFAYKEKYEVTRRPIGIAAEDEDEFVFEGLGLLAIEDVPANGDVTTSSAPDAAAEANDEEDNSDEGNDEGNLSAVDKWVAHARVCNLGDYYEMPDLVVHATGRFSAVANHILSPRELRGFIEVVKEVDRRTFPEDDDSFAHPRKLDTFSLRGEFLDIVARNAANLVSDASFISALREEGLQDIAIDMFGALGRGIRMLEGEAQLLNRSLESAKDHSERTEEMAERLVTLLGRLPRRCHSTSCGTQFSPILIERQYALGEHGPGGWQIRCGVAGCRCRLFR